jgi:threonine dehydratase
VSEGAGAASLAVVMENKDRFEGQKTGLIVSGGNIGSRLLSSILMRGLVLEGRVVWLRVEITDSPGVLSKVSGLIGDSGGNIVEVYHQRLFYDVPVKQAEVDVVVKKWMRLMSARS